MTPQEKAVIAAARMVVAADEFGTSLEYSIGVLARKLRRMDRHAERRRIRRAAAQETGRRVLGMAGSFIRRVTG